MISLRVATRGSKLSLIQVKLAMDYLSSRLGEPVSYTPVIVKTRGDVVQDRPLREIGVKGVFEKEVNKAVLEGAADVAVHSMKDLPGELSPELDIVMVPPRDPPNDSLVFGKGRRPVASVYELPPGSVVGTSSVRRAAFLRHYNSSIVVKPARGNVDTRLGKLMSGEYDYLVLAEAGIRRLGLDPPRLVLPLDAVPPEPGQGLIAVVARRDSEVAKLLSRASDPLATAMARAERAFVRAVGAGCHVPIGGVSAPLGGGSLLFIAAVASESGDFMSVVRLRGSAEEPERLGVAAAEKIRELM